MITNTLQTLQQDIRYVTDQQGNQVFVQIPVAQWQRICLKLRENEHIEEPAESPEVIDKQGVLVVRAKPVGDLTNLTRAERDQRIAELLLRNGL